MPPASLLPPVDDTIAALATAPGESGVAVARISGPGAIALLESCFFPLHSDNGPWTWGRMRLGQVRDASGLVLDEALCVVFPAPRSYTGQDVAELHLHGSPVVCAAVMELLFSLGARAAGPGEFTFRAFASGRLRLDEAEAVADLIASRSRAAMDNARRQLFGELARKVAAIHTLVVSALAQMEAGLDFPEEELVPENVPIVCGRLAEASRACAHLAEGYLRGRRLASGVSCAIVGARNTGKSSLFNRLAGHDRAMVSDVPGTTRDYLTHALSLGGVVVDLVDTAGLGHSDDPLEAMGQERSRDQAQAADILLVVWDRSRPAGDEDQAAALRLVSQAGLLVLNKDDLPSALGQVPLSLQDRVITISCHTGQGIDALRAALQELAARLTMADGDEGVVVTRQRHRQALATAAERFLKASDELAHGLAPELAAITVREGLTHLGELAGETTPDHVLAEIFSHFCVGK